MVLEIPKLSLVVLIGPSGCGKSTFARRHFLPTEVVSSDFCRALVSDDENDQSATNDAFALLHEIVRTRLKRGLLTVVDATNVQDRARAEVLRLAREFYVQSVAIVFDLPESVCQARNTSRPDRQFGPHVIRNQRGDLRRNFFRIQKEFRFLTVLKSEEEVNAVEIVRKPLWNDRKDLTGPFDIVGDVHGCYDELVELLEKLGYAVGPEGEVTPPEGRQLIFVGDLVDRGPKSPEVLRLVRGVVEAGTGLCVIGNHDQKLLRHLQRKKVTINHGLELTLEQLESQSGEFVGGVRSFLEGLISHYVLDGGKLVVAHAGLKEEMHGRAASRVKDFCLYGDTSGEIDEYGLPVRYPWAQEYRGQAMVVYGHTPVPNLEWVNNTVDIDTGCVFGGRLTALRYPERTFVSVPARRTYAISKRPGQVETPVEFGERNPEVTYADRPGAYAVIVNAQGEVALVATGLPGGISAEEETPEACVLRTCREACGAEIQILGEVGRAIEFLNSESEGPVALRGFFFRAQFESEPSGVTWAPLADAPNALTRECMAWAVREQIGQAIGHQVVDDVLDFADISGKRLIETGLRDRVTIREENAIAAIEVISRYAVDPRWLVYLPPTMSPSETTEEPGYLEYPTEALRFYRDRGVREVCVQEKHMGSRTVVVICRDAKVAKRRFGVDSGARGVVLTRTGRSFFNDPTLETALLDQLDAELTASATWQALETDWLVLDCELMPWSAKAQELLRRQYAPVGVAAQNATQAALAALTTATVPGTEEIRERTERRLAAAERYVASYSRYCWPVSGLADLRLAPFHILAGEGRTFFDKDHRWHMETIGRFTGEGVLFRTNHRYVDLSDDAQVSAAIQWWEERTNAGSEGMVIKPIDFIARGEKGLVQPALKCRGGEYLRIIYGPEYTEPANLERLRKRGLSAKRSLALREFALGVEGLERFVRFDSLRRVHECVFGVLALESEPVDPRL